MRECAKTSLKLAKDEGGLGKVLLSLIKTIKEKLTIIRGWLEKDLLLNNFQKQRARAFQWRKGQISRLKIRAYRDQEASHN